MQKTVKVNKTVPKCPFLEMRRSCVAASNVYFPSYFQNLEYCTTRRHKMCPFYQMTKNTDLKIGNA